MHMDSLAIGNRATGGPLAVDRPSRPDDGNRSMLLLEHKIIAILQCNDRIVRLAKLAGTFDNGLENRSDFGWRGCDYAQDIGAAGLVSQRLLGLVEQPRIL